MANQNYSPKSLKVVFFGTPEFVLPVVSAIDEQFDLVAVVTTPDAKVGRKQILTPTPIADYATSADIPVFKPEKLTSELLDQLTPFQPDLFIVASYGKIIPQSVLDLPLRGSINIHPSKLPLFRGATPIQSQILEDIKYSAISFILMDKKMDHGPIIHQEPFTITPFDTNETLHNSMFIKSAEILGGVISDYLQGVISPKVQNDSEATFCQSFNRESGYFAIENPPSVTVLDRMIRGFYPWPSAWTKWNGKIIKFLPVPNNELKLDSPLKLEVNWLVQPEGKNPMKWKDFLNGYTDFPLKEK